LIKTIKARIADWILIWTAVAALVALVSWVTGVVIKHWDNVEAKKRWMYEYNHRYDDKVPPKGDFIEYNFFGDGTRYICHDFYVNPGDAYFGVYQKSGELSNYTFQYKKNDEGPYTDVYYIYFADGYGSRFRGDLVFDKNKYSTKYTMKVWKNTNRYEPAVVVVDMGAY